MPEHCGHEGYKVVGKNFLLDRSENQRQQRLYILHNSDNQAIYVKPRGKHPVARVGWLTIINPGRFTALALDKDNFTLSCAQRDNGKMQSVPCQRVLQICSVNSPKFTVGTGGSYWLAENRYSIRQVESAVSMRGVKL